MNEGASSAIVGGSRRIAHDLADGRAGSSPLRWPIPAAVWLEGLALTLILAGALAMRLTDLDGARSNFPDLFDEGIRAEQLFLMTHGFRPYRDIYAAQGPLLLDALYPFYRLFGETLGAIRLGVGVLSVVGLVGAYLVAREVGGRVGGLLACGLLALSPAYLEGSRLALAEVPSTVPALFAVALVLRYRAGAGRGWLVGSALLLGVALLLKPMIVPAAIAVALAVLMRDHVAGAARGLVPGPLGAGGTSAPLTTRTGVLADLILYGLIVVALAAVVVRVMGAREVFEQLVAYRAGATGAAGWDPRASWKEAVQGPISAHPSLYALALLGAVLLLLRAPRAGAPLVAWALATFGLLFVYTPLHPKHLVYLVAPAAVLGGAGLGVLWRARAESGALSVERRHTHARRSTLHAPLAFGSVAALAVLLLAWDVVTVQPALARGVQLSLDEDDLDLHVFDDVAGRSLRALVPPDGFVLTDHPYIAFLARRMVPPELVDPSRGRTRAGTLTDDVAARAATDRDARVVLFWADRLRRLGRFNAWVEQRYHPVVSFGTRMARNKRGKDRTVYLRNDADFAAARTALLGLLDRPLGTEFAGDLRLLGATLGASAVDRGEPFAVTMGWEGLRDVRINYHVILSLVGPDGAEYAAQEQDIEGTGDGTIGWGRGSWLFRSFMLVPDATAPAGEYRVVVGLDNTRTTRPADVTANPDGLEIPTAGRVVVGTIHVR